MTIERKTDWLIKLAIGVALPTVSCFGFYTVGHMNNPDSITIFLTVLAYPLLLMGLIGSIRVVITKPFSPKKSLPWLSLVGLSSVYLASIWY